MTTFLKNRDMKFSFHLLLACIALTACSESGKTTADYRIVPCPGRNRARRRRRFRTGRPHPDHMHRRQRRHARQCGVSRRICRIGRRLGPRNHRSGRPLRRRQGSHPAGRRAGQRRRSVRNRGFRKPHHRQRESDAGVFYGIQTLRKAMGAAKAAKVLFPAVRIADEPYLGYRGVMLDVGRTFYPVEEVKRIIDLAALHNLNVFHWHLTDDQGWRIEIDAYPRLTETGAFRRDTTLAASRAPSAATTPNGRSATSSSMPHAGISRSFRRSTCRAT